MQPIYATITGTVVYAGPMVSKPKLSMVTIKQPNGVVASIMYVDPSISIGTKIKKGEEIGRAQDIHVEYKKNIPNHVHVQYTNGTYYLSPDGKYAIIAHKRNTSEVAKLCRDRKCFSPVHGYVKKIYTSNDDGSFGNKNLAPSR